MGSFHRPDLIETLVAEEIRRIVADEITGGSFVSTSVAASQILRVYPTCGLTKKQIVDRIIMAASAAGVPVEIGEAAPPEVHSSRKGANRAD
jgi:hypothetical protein